MEYNFVKHQKLLSIFLTKIFVSMKNNSIKTPILLIISNLLENADRIIIVDIIFNYKRTFINLYYPIYFLSPFFYFEYINNKLINNKYSVMQESRYERDQISKILIKYFNTNVYEQIYFKDLKYVTMIFIGIYFIFLIILTIKSNKNVYNIMKKISNIFIYIFFCSLKYIFCLLFCRKILVQFSDDFEKINYNYIIYVILMFIYIINLYFFYSILIYSYYYNEIIYFLQKPIFICNFCEIIIGIIIFIIRFNLKYSILFQVLWVIIIFYIFYVKFTLFKQKLHLTKYDIIEYFINSFVFSLFVSRFISVFTIKKLMHEKEYKIFELILIILIPILIYVYLTNSKQIISLNDIKTHLENNNYLFFNGIIQLYYPFFENFEYKNYSKKNSEKFKDNIFNEIYEDIQKYFIKSKDDLLLFKNNKDYNNNNNINNINSINKNKIINNPTEENKSFDLLTMFLSYQNLLHKIAESKNDKFCKKALDVLNYGKILLYYINDNKTFRSDFYLKKYYYNEKFDRNDILKNAIYKYLIYSFRLLEKKIDENSLIYIIYFNLLDLEYLNIIKSFKTILISFTKIRKELIKIIDKQSDVIGLSINKIIKINKQIQNSIRIKEQQENEKFKLVEDILFNSNFDKNLDYFDINNLDGLIDKNTFFICLFQNGNFIVKKTPLIYEELTGIKTSKLFNLPSINIYPYLIRNYQREYIMKSLLKKHYCKEENVLETKEHFLINVKIIYNSLPSYKGKIYVICNIDSLSFPENSNVILIQQNGLIILYGMFFKTYFGFTNQLKRLNLYSMFNLNEYEPSLNKVQTFQIEINDVIVYIKNHLIKDSGLQNSEIQALLKKIRGNLKNNKLMKIEIIHKKTFKSKNNNIYLLSINLVDIQINSTSVKKQIQIEEERKDDNFKLDTPNNGSVATNSQLSTNMISYKLLKENNWNISNKQKNNFGSFQTLIEKISFIYNLVLIIIAIFLCIFIQILSRKFKKQYVKMINIRELINYYLTANFYVSNMIKINNSDNVYDSLNSEYEKVLENYNITLKDLYKYNFNITTQSLTKTFQLFKNNYSNYGTDNKVGKKISESIYLLISDGSIMETNFKNVLEIPRNYFYILSTVEGYYQTVNQINYDEIINKMPNLSINNQFIYSIVYNTFDLLKHIFGILFEVKKHFGNNLNFYKTLIYFFFVVFLSLNFFSLFLLYLSIKVIDNKIYNIVNKIFELTKKGKNFLLEKLKSTKKIINNEMKSSLVIEKLKNLETKFKKKKNNLNSNFEQTGGDFTPINFNINPNLNSPNNNINSMINSNNENNDDDDEDIYLIKINDESIKKKYLFNNFITAIKILIILGSVYLIFIVITFPVLVSYFNSLTTYKEETDNIIDLQDLLFTYYIETKYLILVNKTDLIDDLDLFGRLTNYIYSNYTELKKLIINKNKKTTVNFINKINEQGAAGCESLLNNDDYEDLKYSLLLICNYEPILQTRFETMMSGFMNQIRRSYITFIQDDPSLQIIIQLYHNRLFQINNLVIIIYFQNYLNELQQFYILPEFNQSINELTLFLVIIFVIMVITEIINYCVNILLILGKLNDSLNNFIILQKFFDLKGNSNQNNANNNNKNN